MEDTLIMDAVINKYFAGETSDREEQFLMAWLEESEEHRKYFFELKSIWNARNVFAESADLGRFAAFMRSTDARIAKIAGEERARRRRGLLRWSMSAAAAVLLVVCAGFAWHFLAGPDIYRVYENNTETVTTVTLDDDAKGKGGKNDEELLVKSNVISVKDEVASMGPKILGKIDLSGKGPKAAPAATPARLRALRRNLLRRRRPLLRRFPLRPNRSCRRPSRFPSRSRQRRP